MAARLQPLPEQVKVYRPAVSGLEPDSVTFADAAGLLLLLVSAACMATMMLLGLPRLSAKWAETLCSV